MKKFLFLFVGLFFALNMLAEDRYGINILNEISYQQAQNYPKQWEISTYKYTNPYGQTSTRYFIFAPSIKHNSTIVLIRAKQPGCPWQVRIDGRSYYADFRSSNDLKVGDEGVLKYDGDRLYMCVD